MKIFGTSSNTKSTGSGTIDVQSAPFRIGPGGTLTKRLIKVDVACRIDDSIVVAGWRTEPVELSLRAGNRSLSSREIGVSRPDVATHFAAPPQGELGFALVADYVGHEPVSLVVNAPGATSAMIAPLTIDDQSKLDPAHFGAVGAATALIASSLPPHSTDWRRLVTGLPASSQPCRTAKGFLEVAAASEHTKDGVIVGWAIHGPESMVWLEDDAGHTYSLDSAHRRFRQDVHDAVGHELAHAHRNAGFVVRVSGLDVGARVRLKALSPAGLHVLGELQCAALPADPPAAARWLFGIATPLADLHDRIPVVDEPILGALMNHRQRSWEDLPIVLKRLGEAPCAPQASIIVPLYGRADFVEHQLIEFADDPWITRHAELIYVVDDPRLVESFRAQAEALHRLYRIPFTWVWGSANRGYSGANNLGAAHAHGDCLVFLNSDAFPQGPGWLEQLVDLLATRPDVGAVGPRLVFADGSIQHAGMAFMRRDELGIWTNHHPRMGLDPSLDPHRDLAIVPSVTGACLAIRRTDFDRVGGWDTGYLIGDFEDSDLCLKLRAEGMNIGYLPSVQLTHLERQSFRLLGEDEFRSRVVVYNAVRHQNRWHELIVLPAAA